jgi:hypothetical protein
MSNKKFKVQTSLATITYNCQNILKYRPQDPSLITIEASFTILESLSSLICGDYSTGVTYDRHLRSP